ncbi:MAG: hypothetical protein COX19_03135 [Desulfobacterales bacterium CG23_combo_of_CG06-09_8_20_14_all_51_8]|nr:MAG: hypothetical protein COX19_03135 [Desulfobacterales bacterium CG23_combo_of_CG06-09_8_20_14_all_51_8]
MIVKTRNIIRIIFLIFLILLPVLAFNLSMNAQAFAAGQIDPAASHHPSLNANQNSNPSAVESGPTVMVNKQLTDACLYGRIDEVKKLLESGADPNSTDSYHQSALCIAAWKGHLEIVALLLEKGAVLNGNATCKPIFSAITSTENYDIAEFLIKKGADVNARD